MADEKKSRYPKLNGFTQGASDALARLLKERLVFAIFYPNKEGIVDVLHTSKESEEYKQYKKKMDLVKLEKIELAGKMWEEIRNIVFGDEEARPVYICGYLSYDDVDNKMKSQKTYVTYCDDSSKSYVKANFAASRERVDQIWGGKVNLAAGREEELEWDNLLKIGIEIVQ